MGDWLIALIANPSTSAFAGNWTRANYSVVVASVFNNDLFLAKADNLTGLADPDAALMNLGGTAPGLVLFKAADVAAQQSALELQAAIDTALATGLPGTRELIEAVDLAGLVSHDFTQFDPTRFIGYEMEFVAMDIGASGGADLSLRTSADGVTFDDTPGDYTITRLANGDPADNASNSSTTSEEILLHSGLSYSAGDTSNARLTIMRPDLLAPTMIRGKWWVERTNSFEYIDLYAQRTAALPVTALRFSRRFPPNTFTAGFVYLFGIRA